MHVIKPDCRDCIRFDEEAAKRDPHYVCTANHAPYPRECWDSHAREQVEQHRKGRKA